MGRGGRVRLAEQLRSRERREVLKRCLGLQGVGLLSNEWFTPSLWYDTGKT